MNILFINDPSPYGGASAALLQLTRELTALGHNITVCTSKTPELDKKLRAAGAKVISCGHIPALTSKSAYALKTLVKLAVFGGERLLGINRLALKKIEKSTDLSKTDIIHTNSARSDLGCMIADKYCIPHIIHLREFRTNGFFLISMKYRFIKYISDRCNMFIAVSDAVKDNWVKSGLDSRKVIKIYDGVELKAENKHKSSSKLRIIMAGSIEELKGQHICIKAIRCLPKRIRENVTLDIYGWEDHRYKKYLDRLIKKYELDSQIRFLGVRDGIGDILCNYDIGVMASRCEGFGLVTAEYMAAGLGVIASGSGASPEIVEHGKNGLIFNRDDPKQLAGYIARLYSDRALLKTLGQNARKKALAEFTAKTNAKRINDLYIQILEDDIRRSK